MNDVERKLKQFEYFTNADKAASDLEEYSDVIKALVVLLSDAETVNKMSPIELTNLLVDFNDFTTKVKPIVVKYAIIDKLI